MRIELKVGIKRGKDRVHYKSYLKAKIKDLVLKIEGLKGAGGGSPTENNI